MAPSTFASAAAGSNSTANSTRNDSGGEWSRRANGATQTFRRPSHATTLSNAASTNASSPGVYVPPHRNGTATAENRYPKDSLLSLFRQITLDSDDGLDALYAGGWEPQSMNGASGGAWGRSNEHGKENPPGPDVCWDREGTMQPLGLSEMTEEEKEHFASSVNSPLKIPNQNANKDNNPKDALGRKTSVSHANGPGNYGLSSPTTNRPGTRRRDTGDAYPFPSAGSPATSRFTQESNAAVPPPALLRRRTDYKEPSAGPGAGQEERDKDKAPGDTAGSPFGLKRSTTGPFSAGISGPSSPWSAGPQSAGFSPMGSFGNFSLATNTGQASTPTDKRPGIAALRGESRFKGLMNKDSAEDMQKTLREKASMNSLGKVPENDQGRQTPSWMETRANRPLSNDTDPYADDDNMRSGSAALGGGQDTSPPRRQMTGFGTPQRQDSRDESGFSAFGMTADNTGFSSFLQSRDAFHHHTPQHQGLHGNEPMSPTDTNPYQSPQHEKHESEDIDTDGSDIHSTALPGLGGFMNDPAAASGMSSFGGIGNIGRVSSAYEAAASDRSQTSSVGPNRGFPSLGGLGGLPGLGGSSAWPSAQPAVGTPNRERFNQPFGDNTFGSVGEMHSPSLAGLGPNNLYGGGFGSGLGGTGSIGRGSKLGSLFPTAMQEQMRSSEQGRFGDDGSAEGDRQHVTFGRNAFGGSAGPHRETDSPFRGGRGVFDEMLANSLRNNEGNAMEGLGQFASPGTGATQTPTLATSQQQGPIGQHVTQGIPGQSQPVSSSASNQPPAAQQRTMVMPDRMRWVYRDPTGRTQGPWTGLEMHDWFKAGFFSPELLVKKEEDPEYEPLAQLIRRIGNSREPFLVPQIGIPHGPPSTQPGNAWANAGITAGNAQPPFPNSFPSFGTTLTAEQQNALERRKQEEQYLMARQKEHLAQQQVIVKQMQLGMHPQQLHHHSSAHSLHSQPSFGSIASPGGYQPSPTQGPMPGMAGFFDNSFRSGGGASGLPPIGAGVEGLGSSREDLPAMLDRMNLGRSGQVPFGAAPGAFGSQQQDGTHAQQVANMLNDRARLQREQRDHEAQSKDNEGLFSQESAERLQQFQELREERERESAAGLDINDLQQGKQTDEEESCEEPSTPAQTAANTARATETPGKASEPLSLTEQVKAASAKQTPAPQSPWAKIDTTMPMPFPPPQSGSPLPAPAAQRKQNLADALHQETRSRSQTPSVDTPSASIAPWAKETVEAPKGPSLKEIQEAEAKKREEAEAAAQAARAEQQRKEFLAAHEQAQPQPSLPSSATWASNASPVNAPGTPSAWTKATIAKTPSSAGPMKKTLQQIQKEEEARKQKAAAAAAATAASAAATAAVSQAVSGGKRYADLASKQAPITANAPGGAWTTVGASGKIKTPGSATVGPIATRTPSAGSIPAIKPKPAPPTRAVSQAAPPVGALDAKEEFKKWAANELRNDLIKGTDADEFVSNMLSFPIDLDIVTEAVHSVSQTIDSRHFAQEFIRRRKLAEKGIIENTGTSSPGPVNGSGGWSEVAKKGSTTNTAQTSAAKEDVAFKVVAAKKKGSRK